MVLADSLRFQIFALQSANVYPFLYMLLNARQQRVSQSSVIWFLLVLGFVVALLMSALWDKTSVVFGARHSVGRTRLRLLLFPSI